jgi:hypothetical protein
MGAVPGDDHFPMGPRTKSDQGLVTAGRGT